jgi:hypothetical protein
MPIGRPRAPGTDAERAEARRAKVRVNVQAFRRRQKEKKLAAEALVKANQERNFLSLPDDLSESASSLATTASPSPSWQEQESDYADPDSWIWQLSHDLSNDSSYQDAFLAALQHRCLPYQQIQDRVVYEPCKRFSICASAWLPAGALEIGVSSNQIMSDAVLASALTIVGRSRGDIDMTMRGAFIQSRALRGLRITLQELASEHGTASAILPMQALTCAVAELLSNNSWDNFASHLTGVGALIEHGGPDSLKARDVREHFYGYRSLQAAFSFMHGHATFLADPEWTNPKWKNEVELAFHPLHTMLDVGFKLVPELHSSPGQQVSVLNEAYEKVQRLRALGTELDAWERNLKIKQGGRLYNKRDATWSGLYDYAFDFVSLSVGIAFAMYTGVRIKLAWTIKETIHTILTQDPNAAVDTGEAVWEGLKWARQALQSIEFFHTGRPKASGKIVTLFPLDVAWGFISEIHAESRIDLTDEKQWCLSTAHRLAASDPEYPVFRWR